MITCALKRRSIIRRARYARRATQSIAIRKMELLKYEEHANNTRITREEHSENTNNTKISVMRLLFVFYVCSSYYGRGYLCSFGGDG